MTKNAENTKTAAVKLQVALRVGQRTCFSSVQAPLKYPKNPFIGFDRDFLSAEATAGFGLTFATLLGNSLFLEVEALIRVIDSSLLFDFATDVLPKLKVCLLQTVNSYYSLDCPSGQALVCSFALSSFAAGSEKLKVEP